MCLIIIREENPLNNMWCVCELVDDNIYVNKSHSQFQSFNSWISGSMWWIELIRNRLIVYYLMGVSCN